MSVVFTVLATSFFRISQFLLDSAYNLFFSVQLGTVDSGIVW
jgi:hypothetical protein